MRRSPAMPAHRLQQCAEGAVMWDLVGDRYGGAHVIATGGIRTHLSAIEIARDVVMEPAIMPVRRRMPYVDHRSRDRRTRFVGHLTTQQQRLVAVIVIGLQRAVDERSVVQKIRAFERAEATAEVVVFVLTF